MAVGFEFRVGEPGGQNRLGLVMLPAPTVGVCLGGSAGSAGVILVQALPAQTVSGVATRGMRSVLPARGPRTITAKG